MATGYLTTREIANQTGWEQENVNKLIRMGILPAVRVKTAKAWRYKVPAEAFGRLLKFIEETNGARNVHASTETSDHLCARRSGPS